jgi:hypothetical protein
MEGEKLPRELPREARVRALVDIEDVDGVICAALILKRFPNAIIETASVKGVRIEGRVIAKSVDEMAGEYDIVADLSLPRSVGARIWVDHHLSAIQEGKCEERIYDPSAKSAAGLLARYLGIEAGELGEIADRADSVSYLTEPPLGFEPGYDPAWDVNDAVKAISSSERFLELAKALASEGLEGVREKFRAELAHTRALRTRAEKAVRTISKQVKEQGADSLILLMPRVERRGSTVSAHIVFSLYRRREIKAAAVFYEGGCWINVGGGFDGLDASAVAKRLGGGGHRVSAGAPIGPDKLEDIKREFEKVGLKALVVDLRGGI